MISLILGLFTGMLLAFLYETLSLTIRTSDDVQRKLGLSTLGILPLIKGQKIDDPASCPMLGGVHTAFTESVRSIRTGLILSGIDNPHKVIHVTSTVPGEGKTTVSINLAVAMSQMEKTLLVGADMRRPSLKRICDLPGDGLGLSDVVAGEADLKSCIQVNEQTGLHILLSGSIPPNPLELLSSKRFANLIKDIESQYDRIIIDSPPINLVSDALILSQYAKAVVYVVHADKTHQRVVKNCLDRLAQYEAPLAGIVLNKVDFSKMGKDYKYSGYYDHYGYNNDEKKA